MFQSRLLKTERGGDEDLEKAAIHGASAASRELTSSAVSALFRRGCGVGMRFEFGRAGDAERARPGFIDGDSAMLAGRNISKVGKHAPDTSPT